MSDRTGRPPGRSRALAWTSVACIAASLLVMIGVSAAGPSIVVPAMARASGGPPWWWQLNPQAWFLYVMWGTAVVAAVGVGAGIAAVARGARPPVKPLLAASFIAVAVLTVLPPAGSTDAQSYAIDGNMVVTGRSPYVETPAQMAAAGNRFAANSPSTWQRSLSDYGPLATGEEWLSAELGGWSMAAVTFWLKLWVSLAFVAVTILLDRVLRSDPARRLRAHLLWSLNPLVLWEIVAAGHVDGLAVAFGLGGLLCLPGGSRLCLPRGSRSLRPRCAAQGAPAPFDPPKGARAAPFHPLREGLRPPRLPIPPRGVPTALPSLARCASAGALIGLAGDIKITFLAFGIGAVWALRRSVAGLAALAAGAAVILVPSYAAFGMAAVRVLSDRSNQVTWDNLYQLIYRPLENIRFGVNAAPTTLPTIALVLVLAVAALAFLRMPDRAPGLPAVTPAFAVSIAWIFFWPFQRPWYDVMIIALLVLYQRSWLDWLVLVRLCFAAITYMESSPAGVASVLQHVQLFQGEWITSAVRFLTALALVCMCLTRRWGFREEPLPAAGDKPVLHTPA